jgi:hypothetical protein
MGCSKKMSVKIPTTDRCNKMIDGFDKQISDTFKTKHKYSKKERTLLIKTIKENPTHFWEVGINGLIHYGI